MTILRICNNYCIILLAKYGKNPESCEENDYFLVCLVGTLRRSETIFIDVRDLPVLESESSLPNTSGELTEVFSIEKVGYSSADARKYLEHSTLFQTSGESTLFSSSNELGAIPEDCDDLPR